MSFTFHVLCSTFHVSRFTFHVSRFTFHVSRLTQHATRNTQHATRNTQHATRNTQHATRCTYNTPNPKSQILYPNGFTLLEVLVASIILSLVLAILYGVFSQTLTSKRVAEERAALSRTARIVLLRIGEDLQSSFPFAPTDARFVGTTRRTSTFPHSSVSFMSFANTIISSANRAGDWNTITYDLIPDPMTPTLWQLVRRVQPSSESSANAHYQQDKDTLPLLTRVQGFRVRFFDGRMWSEDWGKERTKARVPLAVEVELRLAPAEEHKKRTTTFTDGLTFTTLVDLPLARPIEREGQPGGS